MSEEILYSSVEDSENWISETPDEVIQEILSDDDSIKYNDLITIYKGEKQSILFSEYVTDISDGIFDQAYDDLGDLTNDLLSTEQAKALDDAVRGFVGEYAIKNDLNPSFYRVINIEPVKVKMTAVGDNFTFELFDLVKE